MLSEALRPIHSQLSAGADFCLPRTLDDINKHNYLFIGLFPVLSMFLVAVLLKLLAPYEILRANSSVLCIWNCLGLFFFNETFHGRLDPKTIYEHIMN